MSQTIFAKRKDTFATSSLKQLIMKCLNPTVVNRPIPVEILTEDTFLRSTKIILEKEQLEEG